MNTAGLPTAYEHGGRLTPLDSTVDPILVEIFQGTLASVEMEVRASWTPLGADIGQHLVAWSDLLCTIAGLPPLPEGVIALPGQRR